MAARRGSALALALVLIGALLAWLPGGGGAAAAQDPPPPIRVNLHGPDVTVDAQPFAAEASTEGLTVVGHRHCTPTDPTPATSAETATMLRCFVWGSGTGTVQAAFSSLPAGDRDVYVWVFEDDAAQTFELRINGSSVATVDSGAAGTWQRLGPFRSSTSGTLTIDTSGGDANLSAVELLPATGTPTTPTTPGGPPAGGAWTPDDFSDEAVITGLVRALSADWMPDGRMLVVGKNGHVHVADPRTGSQSLYFQIPDVEATGERGALDILVDPDFTSNRRFYVYYSAAPSTRLRIVRYTFTGNGTDDLANGSVLWENPGPLHSNYGEYHIGGSLNIGPDGHFYLTVGDGLQPSNAQTLTNVFGKVLRIGPDGSPPTDNPFYDGPGPNIDEIWAYGLRNTFRSWFDRPTDRYFIGDVGGNNAPTAYEEINLGRAGANYGWPLCEGPVTGPKNGAACPAGIEGPILWYPHDATGGCCQNAAITAGEVVRSSALPAGLDGAFLFGDYARREIRYATFTSSGDQIATSGLLKSVPDHQPVWISAGPDGHLYYVHFDYEGATGEIRRLRYTGTTRRPPVISIASLSSTSGPAPLVVDFTASASDPDGQPVSYLWDFGDGQTSTAPNVSHTYTTAGSYTARLRVTAGSDTVFGEPVAVRVGQPPVADITSPADGWLFRAGDTITVTGTATDDHPLPDGAMTWEVVFVHDEHTHPVSSGAGDQIQIPIGTTGHGYEGDTGYRVTLAVTDRDGLRSIDTIELRPRKVPIALTTNLPGAATVRVDGIQQQLPFTIDTLEGFHHRIEAPVAVCLAGREWRFTEWSGGRPATFDLTVPASASTLTATYAPGAGCTDPSAPPGSGRVGVGGARSSAGGVWVGYSDGSVETVGNAAHLGDAAHLRLNAPMVGLAPTSDHAGYWLLGGDGGVFSYNAPFHGSTGGMRLNQPVVGMAPHPVNGYWTVAADGGVFSFAAPFFGSTGGMRLNRPVVGMEPTNTGNGYWLVATDGGIFAFGDAHFSGSTGHLRLNQPIVGMAADPDGVGYWTVAADGGVFSFDATFHGSGVGQVAPGDRVVGMVAHPGGGYWLVTARGAVLPFAAAVGVSRPPS